MKLLVMLLLMFNLSTGKDTCNPLNPIPRRTYVQFVYNGRLTKGLIVGYLFSPPLPAGRCEFQYRIRIFPSFKAITRYPGSFAVIH